MSRSFRTLSGICLRLFLLAVLLVSMFAVSGVPAAHAAGIVVTSNADDSLANLDANATCDLREAITNANDDAATYSDCGAGSGADTITFDIPGAGPHVITVTGADLPSITGRLMIDGLPNEVGATCPLPTAPLGIQIDAAAIRVDGLVLAAGSAGSTIRGLSITNFDDDGIEVDSSNNRLTCNYLGLAADGNTPGGNRWGVFLTSTSSGSTVGGSTAGDGNAIAHNANDGVVISGSNNAVRGNLIRNHADAGIAAPTGTSNRFSQNSIHSNTNLGIDLLGNGLSPNDAGDGDGGANNQQNFPVLSSVTSAGVVNGSLDSLASNSAYPVQIEFFANTACDSSGHGEGDVYLCSTSIAAPGSFTTPLNLVSGKNFITATAIDSNGNTSEFSACQQVTPVADLTISKTHTSEFMQGQSGAQYTITVTNTGSAPTSGMVTVVDTLPAGLTATAITGTDWNCTLATLTCDRSDALAASTSYPNITLTVNVASDAPSGVTNNATVSGGAEQNTGNNTASDPTTINPPANNPPTAVEDSYSTDEDTPLPVAAPGVLESDTDPDAGDTLTAVLVSSPSHAASFTLNSDGSFSYTPAANYNGPDSFSYMARDGQNSDSAPVTVSLTVSPINDAPTVAIAAAVACTSTASGTMGLTVADAESSAGSLTLSGSSSDTKVVPNGNIVFGGSGANRTVSITALPQKSMKSANITITLSDGTVTSTTTLKVIVGTDKNETFNGSSGADMIFGSNGSNTINGGDGIDLLCGANGDDTISGGNGNDSLNGQNGNDILRGNDGDDRLTGASGADSFSGGAGTDIATDFSPSQRDTLDGTTP